MIAMVNGIKIYATADDFWAQEYTSDRLPKSPDNCKRFKSLQGALMWAARQ